MNIPLHAPIPLRLLAKGGKWLLEVERYVAVRPQLFRPRRETLEGEAAILRALATSEEAELSETARTLMRGGLAPERCYEVVESGFSEAALPDTIAAARPPEERVDQGEQEMARLRDQLLTLTAKVERMRVQLGELGDGTATPRQLGGGKDDRRAKPIAPPPPDGRPKGAAKAVAKRPPAGTDLMADLPPAGGTDLLADDDSASLAGRDLMADDDSASLAGRDLMADDDSASLAGRDLMADDDSASLAGRDLMADDSASLAGRDLMADDDSASLAGQDLMAGLPAAPAAPALELGSGQAHIEALEGLFEKRVTFTESTPESTPGLLMIDESYFVSKLANEQGEAVGALLLEPTTLKLLGASLRSLGKEDTQAELSAATPSEVVLQATKEIAEALAIVVQRTGSNATIFACDVEKLDPVELPWLYDVQRRVDLDDSLGGHILLIAK